MKSTILLLATTILTSSLSIASHREENTLTCQTAGDIVVEPMQFSYYVINLKTSESRLKKIKRSFGEAKLDFSRIDAVNGKELDLVKLKKDGVYNPSIHKARWLRPSEVGCYFSHRKAWSNFLQSGSSYGVVFEDDVAFSKDIQIKIEDLVARAPKDWSILYLGCNSEHKSEFFKPCHPANNKKIHGAPLMQLGNQCVAGMWAYIVNRESAQMLLENTLPVEWPIDYAIKNYFVGEQRFGEFKAYCARPELAKTGGQGSDIGNRGECASIACK